MVVKRGGLGRNLSALLSQASSTALLDNNPGAPQPVTHRTLAIHALQPGKYQPRRDIEDGSLQELAKSIKQHGLLQPLVVREIHPEQYEIIAGERRWRACQIADILQIPVIVRQVDDETAMAMALIENLQREDLNVIDQAFAMQRLVNEFDLTHQQIADLLSKSRTNVSNYLRLLNLNSDVRCLLERGDLDMGHARCLLVLDHEQQTAIAQQVVNKNLSVRETEALVARMKAGADVRSEATTDIADIALLFKKQMLSLSKQLQTNVTLKPGKKGCGSLVIHYDGEQNLEQLIERLIN